LTGAATGSYTNPVLASDEWTSPADFHVVVDASARPPCVFVSGEIDLVTVAPFRDALSEAIAEADGAIVVDFARVSFMGSTGIRELVRALENVQRIEIRTPSPIVRRAIETAAVGHGLVIT
jgi:anti-anti-sigma factor